MVDIAALSALPTGLADPVETRAILRVNGRRFNSWKSISINRSIANISGSFSFTTSNRFAGEGEKWGIEEGDPCTVDIADERVLTGYIDDISDGYSVSSHDVTFSGRDKTADLVDCHYNPFEEVDQAILTALNNTLTGNKGGKSEFNNQTFLQIIEKLCAPFNISVELDSALLIYPDLFQPIAKETMDLATPVYEKIAYLCQLVGVLPITTGNGNLFLTRAGVSKANDDLQVGVNIKANRVIRSVKDRYSVYYAEGQSITTAFNSNLIAEGKAEDEYMKEKRVRPYIIMLGEHATIGACQKKAAWEARIRMGASRKVETQVRKWTQTNGKIWPLNGLVQMFDSKIGVNAELLIAGLALNLDGTGGELTTMSLVHPDTFILKERVPIKKTDGLNAFNRPMGSKSPTVIKQKNNSRFHSSRSL